MVARCPLQSIASENNLSETAFFVPAESGFHLRWFTPVCEVDLCGHATLAAAHVLFRHLGYPVNSLVFHTRSGALEVEEKDGLIIMDFPARRSKPCPPPDELVQAVGKVPVEVWAGKSYIAVYESADDIRSLVPDDTLLRSLDLQGVAAMAPGGPSEKGMDFVSRYFAPKVGVSEDPVTGSAHLGNRPDLRTLPSCRVSMLRAQKGSTISRSRPGFHSVWRREERCLENC